MELQDIIKYENESTIIEFKAIQYKKEQYVELLKDIMSMANADIEADRYIICGVKSNESYEKSLIGLKEELIDSATFHQLIESNIEPSLKIEYKPLELDGKLFGIFTIGNCSDQPYMMKKAYGDLKKGDCYIRKGTYKETLGRGDIDRIIKKKISNTGFSGEVECDFENSIDGVLFIKPVEDVKLPSVLAKEKIEKIIKSKKENLAKLPPSFRSLQGVSISPVFGNTSYENRSIETLQLNLINVAHDFSQDDSYYTFSELSEKINLRILNKGQEYIFDATVELLIPMNDGFNVYKEFVNRPNKSGLIMKNIPEVNFGTFDYPDVSFESKMYRIKSRIGDIKHNIHVKAFKTPLRLFFPASAKRLELKAQIIIHGKNLKTPLHFERLIKCI